ncbi:uncharacterized protein LOC112462157 [Temnothorax curvispinosus]|uniref:Uncharacterized protein LOC112462157 n=1 Tax=Temnothorax curvispinosus TaxID=300111 RepID=A0A6J1QM80_9HYME|nr:uncharacterized protein LOC112462157 [Temnothorax curvispinosus]
MNYVLVTEPNGNVIRDESGNILVQQQPGNALIFITSSQAATLFPNAGIQAETESSRSDLITDNEQENNTTSRTSWNRNEIIELISLYKSHEHLFKSTTMKKDKVWDMIAQKLPMHTTEQIKNKFKYLKQKYMEKKDNMGQKSSGAGSIKFDYFFEMDEIFGQDPDVQPVSTASSLRGIKRASKTSSIEIEENSCSDDEEITTKKNKKSKIRKRSELAKQLSTYDQNFKEREAKKEERHNELMARQDAALKILENIANSFANLPNTKN